MNKFIFYVMTTVLLFSLIGPSYANAKMLKSTDVETQYENELTKSIESEFENNENVDVNVHQNKENKILVATEMNQDDLDVDVNIKMDTKTEAIRMTSDVSDDNGGISSQNFNVTVHEASEDYLVATFENIDTGEVTKMDSRQVQAAPIPIMVYIIGAAAIRATIVFVKAAKASKAVKALKIGKKTFKKQDPKVATNATKNFKDVPYKTGNQKFKLTKSNMNHILRGHHPKYWTGENKSMFDPDLSINDIKKIVGTIVEKKSKAIEAGLKSRDKEAVVTYKINEVKYRFVVKKDKDNKNYIATLFPLK